MPGNPDDMKKYKLSSVLRRLQTDQHTGTLMSVGEDNVLGRIYLVKGKLKAARCRNLQGKDAVIRINEKFLVSVKFHKNANLVNSQSAIGDNDDTEPDDATDPDSIDISSREYQSAIGITALVDDEDDDESLDKPLTPEIRSILAQELIEYLGPVAPMFVSDLEQEISVGEALNVLAVEIGDMDAAIEFIDKVKPKV